MRERKILIPKISVVTPVYNDAKYIEESILSVLTQDYSSIEHIIIDGASTDGTKEIIEKYSGHLAYWSSEPDEGNSQAINKAFSKTTGDIICILMADERYLPGALSLVADAFNASANIDFVFGEAIIVDESGQEIRRRNYPPMHPYYYMWYGQRLLQPDNCFWSRRAHLLTGAFDEVNFPSASSDEDWFIRLTFNVKGWKRIDQPISIFTERPDRLTLRYSPEQWFEHKRRARAKWKAMHKENILSMTLKWFFANSYRKFLEGRLLVACHPLNSFRDMLGLNRR